MNKNLLLIKNNKKLFINIIITGFIITFLTILNSMYFKVCFNNLNNQNYLKPVAFLFLFLYLSKLIFEFISNYCKNYLIKDINYNLNETFFEKIDTVQKAWMLGFIAADGCIYERDGHQAMLSISVRDYDIEILELFKRYISPEHSII